MIVHAEREREWRAEGWGSVREETQRQEPEWS